MQKPKVRFGSKEWNDNTDDVSKTTQFCSVGPVLELANIKLQMFYPVEKCESEKHMYEELNVSKPCGDLIGFIH